MKIQWKHGLWLGALLMSGPGVARAQESLGGVGAAGAVGATLGAGAAGGLSSGRATRGVRGGQTGDPAQDDANAATNTGAPGTATTTSTTTTTTTRTVVTPPQAQTFSSGTGNDFVSELLAPRSAPVPNVDRVRRTPRAQARYSANTARLTKSQRSKRELQKYKVPPTAWRAAYLPQDRYKFGKIWRFVSTEDDRFYYVPSAMARKRFSPNRVIGFNSYQEALAAGYRPDPVSKPAPGAQIAEIARLYRGPELYTFVEYVYAGQISPESLLGVYSYAKSVDRTLRPTKARPYIGSTVAKILEAALTGDTSIIPRRFDANGPIVETVTTTTATDSGAPAMPASVSAPSAGGGEKRTDEFNNFSNRAGNLANVPANR